MAINLSPLQIKRDLIEVVLQALAASGLPPERLELEITESVLLQDSQNTLATLHQLRQLGVRIAMDDFGTGYCSLSYLRSFPFDKIKIDRAFIADMDRSDESRAIVETIVRLGDSLGMATVAEGIENFEQLKLLCAAGCTRGAGLLLQRARCRGRGRARAQRQLRARPRRGVMRRRALSAAFRSGDGRKEVKPCRRRWGCRRGRARSPWPRGGG